LAGGNRRDGAGYFFEPTIICGLDEDASLVQEEQFGPALPVMRFGDIDDAVSKANATTFGLGGSVWSADLDRARDIATRLECGTVWLNQHGVTYPDVPIGGVKWSGVGYENGLAGLDGFTTIQTVYLPCGT
jgi:acyl-CoA reductase-like NAD-dependent aldehyde dehydrogenase